MARTLTIAFALLTLGVGCQNYDKPRDLRDKPRPNLSQFEPEEQERRIRGRYSIPQDDRAVGPKTFIDRGTPVGW